MIALCGVVINGGIDSDLRVNDFLSVQTRVMLAYDDGIYGFDNGFIGKVGGSAVAIIGGFRHRPMDDRIQGFR